MALTPFANATSTLGSQVCPSAFLPTAGTLNERHVTRIGNGRLVRGVNGSIYLIEKTPAEVIGERIVRPLIGKISTLFSHLASFAHYLPSIPLLPGAYAKETHSDSKSSLASDLERLTNAIDTADLGKLQQALDDFSYPNKPIVIQELLNRACEKGDIDIIREFLDNRGATVNPYPSERIDTPLHRASLYGHAAVVTELIKRGANVHKRGEHRSMSMTPLELAISAGRLDCCKLLLEARAKINVINQAYSSTPLSEACEKGYEEIVELLLDSGANPDLSGGITPLSYAVHHPKILQLLLARGANVNLKNAPGTEYRGGAVALHEAAMWGRVESVRLLLQAGADSTLRNSNDQTPLDKARWQLNYHRTNPLNPPEITNQMIADLETVVAMLSAAQESRNQNQRDL